MNFSLNTRDHEGLFLRSKRDARKDACEDIEYKTILHETVTDLGGDILSLPGLKEGSGVLTGVGVVVSHTSKGGGNMAKIALGCDDIPFDEIKEMFEEESNELSKKLDKQAQALAKVSSMVSATLHVVEKARLDMSMGFNRVFDSINNNSVKEKITQMHNFIEYFLTEKKRIPKLSKDEYIVKLEEGDGFLSHLQESRTPNRDSLHTTLYEIIHNNLAIPKNANDKIAFQTLYALFYGTQVYASVFSFLIESHAYLGDYYYQNGKFEDFNKQITKLSTIFADFKHSLVGDNYGFVVKVGDIIKTVKNKSFMRNVSDVAYKKVINRSQLIDKLKTKIKAMILPIITEIPRKATLQFKEANVNTPLGRWISGVTVRYAVQYEKNGVYSKFGDWSDPLTIGNKACPFIKAPSESGGRNRLIFRKFDDGTPHLVGILDQSKTEFRDINRDLYDAAGEVDRDVGLEDANKFIQHKADPNAIFDLGRTAFHNAAKSGNVPVMELLTNRGVRYYGVKDRKGYTALHVSAENGRSMIIPALLDKGIDINESTIGDRYTALHIAVHNNYKSVVVELLKPNHVRVNAKDKDGFTPVHAAVAASDRLYVTLLRRSDANLNAKSNVGLTPAHLAVMKNDLNIIDLLVEYVAYNKVDLNLTDINNLSPLHYAAMLGNIHTVKRLLNVNGINVNIAGTGNSWTPLHYAIHFKKENVAIELIKRSDTNVQALASGKNTPLHMAAGTGQEQVVKELLNKNVNLNAKDEKGYTALHLAVMRNSMGVIVALVNKGANVGEKTNNNKTPLDLANTLASKQVQDFLKSKNGRRFRKKIEHQSHTFSGNGMPIKMNFRHGITGPFKVDSPIKFSKLLGNDNSFTRIGRSIDGLNVSGTLMLLDVLLRKFTKEKYNFAAEELVPESKLRVMALDITEKFENFFNTLSYAPIDEVIDLSEVYSRVKKALMSGQQNRQLIQVLCSYVEIIPSLRPEVKERVLEKFKLTAPIVRNLENNIGENLQLLLKKTCSM